MAENNKDYFEDIVGYEDVKNELNVIIDMLNNPEVYSKMGTKMIDCLMLVGAPGVGKTSFAKCIFKAVNRKPYVLRKKYNDVEFVNHITDVFKQAMENAPSIILLDDMDKYSDKEKDNGEPLDAKEFVAVQACIDEIYDKDVFVLSTVNELFKIPYSLRRNGRFGNIIRLKKPCKNETEEIVKHYLNSVGDFTHIDTEIIAKMLVGKSCATLESVINNAAIKASYNRQKRIELENIVDACLDIVFEASEIDKNLSEATLKRIAYHEAGHALISEVLDPGSVAVMSMRKTCSDKLGFVRYYRAESEEWTHEYYENLIITSLGGKAAIEIVFGESDLGVNADLHNAFEKAKRLVDNYAVFGFDCWIEDNNAAYVEQNRNRAMSMVLDRDYLEAKRIIARNRCILDELANRLLEKTTLICTEISEVCSSLKKTSA